MKFNAFLLLPFLILSINLHAQTNKSKINQESEFAAQELKIALSGKPQHNVVDKKSMLLNNQALALAVAEPILFSVYGRDKILSEKPYNAYLINNHWVVTGSLSSEMVGGVFLIIIDSRNSSVIKISHGK